MKTDYLFGGMDWNQALEMKWINEVKNKSRYNLIWDRLGTKMNIIAVIKCSQNDV